MIKRELAFAAVVASLLTAGTASAAHAMAAAGCMEACNSHFGIVVDVDGNPYELTSCTEVANQSGSKITCVYTLA